MTADILQFIRKLKPLQVWSPHQPDYYTYRAKNIHGEIDTMGYGKVHEDGYRLGSWNIKWITFPDRSDRAMRSPDKANLLTRSLLCPELDAVQVGGKSLELHAEQLTLKQWVQLCLDNWASVEQVFERSPSIGAALHLDANALRARYLQRS